MPKERLDRLLANSGLGTRTEVRALIKEGAVTVGGSVAKDATERVESHLVLVDGLPLSFPDGLFVAYHKPLGLVCSHDRRDGPRIYDELPEEWLRRNPLVTSIGRLDRDSTGLLLLTDQGTLVHRLSSPKHHVDKRYLVTIDRPVTATMVEAFSLGTLSIDGRPCQPASLVVSPADRLGSEHGEVILSEGRHRQIRRMFEALGAEVLALHRTRVGPYELADLAPSEWRALDLP